MNSSNRSTGAGLTKRVITVLLTFAVIFVTFGFGEINASAYTTYSVPKLIPEKTYDTDYTHPYNRQTDTIKLHWEKVKGAKRYQIYVCGGQYKRWTNYGTTSLSYVTVRNLRRDTEYKFKIRAVYSGSKYSAFSPVQTIKTARMNYDASGWQAVCKIVYHEVGRSTDTMWDKPMVYVSDCVVNRYVAAKYENDSTWAPYYKRYSNIQQIIYLSGGFMSESGLNNSGCSYGNVPDRVKQAAWSAVYGSASYKNIKNDYNIYYWCNSYNIYNSKVAYYYKIPWGGYFTIWRSYWG